jgi:hypothetical protein
LFSGFSFNVLHASKLQLATCVLQILLSRYGQKMWIVFRQFDGLRLAAGGEIGLMYELDILQLLIL